MQASKGPTPQFSTVQEYFKESYYCRLKTIETIVERWNCFAKMLGEHARLISLELLREISELTAYLENIDYLNSLRSSFLLPSIYMIL